MNPSALPAPGLRRRLAAFVYEGVVLFGVLMLAGFVYSLTTGQRHALSGRGGMQVFLFVVLGIYFVWFWTHGGQTVATKAWRLKVVGPDGGNPSVARAIARYLLSWMWFVPALLTVQGYGLQGTGRVAVVLGIWVVGYALLSLLLPGRQFLHDRLAGTRVEPVAPPPAPPRR
jgi:uncharacterized RDD family membrane protein YckC